MRRQSNATKNARTPPRGCGRDFAPIAEICATSGNIVFYRDVKAPRGAHM
jgi:hypothetical protein